jgi:hypothetical protein
MHGFGALPGVFRARQGNLAQGMVRETSEFLQGDVLFALNLFNETPSNFAMRIEWAGFLLYRSANEPPRGDKS